VGNTRIVHVKMLMNAGSTVVYSCLHESLMNKVQCISLRALSLQSDFLWEEGNKFVYFLTVERRLFCFVGT